MGNAKFRFSRGQADDRTCNCGDEIARRQHGESMESVAKKPKGKSRRRCESSPPCGAIRACWLPVFLHARRAYPAAKKCVTTRGIQDVVIPGESSQTGERSDAGETPWRSRRHSRGS